jgi:hypothetical protein
MNEIVNPSALIPIVFPPNPSVGDTFDAPNGITYTWDGTVWTSTGGGTPPGITGLQYKGPWQVAANVPDLNNVGPEDGDFWTAQTQNYLFAEQAPATIPGLGGMTIWNGWIIQYIGSLSQFVAYNTMTINSDDVNAQLADYVLKAGDTMTGILNWDAGPGIGGEAITIANGSIRLTGLGAVGVMDQGEIRSPLFVSHTDPGGYVFGTTGQDGGMYKKLAGGITLRQSSGNQIPQVELNDGSAAFNIIDARGGDFPRYNSNVALSWSDTIAANVENSTALYQDSLGHFVIRKGYTGFPAATAMITRPGSPAWVQVRVDPVEAMDIATKNYVDTTLASIVAFQGTWQVAANTPDLDPAVMNPVGGWYWVAATADPLVPENAPAGLPGIEGQEIANGDMIIWSDADTSYHHLGGTGGGITKPEADSWYVQLAGSTMTGPLYLSGAPTQDLQAATKAYADNWFMKNMEIFVGDINTLFVQGMFMVIGGTNLPPAITSGACFLNVFTAQTYAIQEVYEMAGDATNPTVIVSKWMRSTALAQPGWGNWAQIFPVPAAGLQPPTPTGLTYGHTGIDWASVLPLSGNNPNAMTGPLILNGALPIQGNEAVSKDYVDSLITGAAQLFGTIDASTGIITLVDSSTIPVPPADPAYNRAYVVCTVAGTFNLPASQGGTATMIVGDDLYCNGTAWVVLAVGGNATMAAQVGLLPAAFGEDNVQSAMEIAETRSIPFGGATGQSLVKLSNNDYDTGWSTGSAIDDAYYMKRYGYTPVDPATITNPGMYYTQGSPPGMPINTNGGYMWVNFSATDPPGGTVNPYQTQELFFFGTGNTILRRWIRGFRTGWGAWQEVPVDLTSGTGQFLPLTGGTLTGPLTISMGGNNNLTILTGGAVSFNMQNQNGTNWSWSFDGGASQQLRLRHVTGGTPITTTPFTINADGSLATFTGNVASAPAPVNPEHLVNKAYVDGIVASATVLIGSIDAATGDCLFTDGSTGPVPAANRPGEYLICTNPGTIPSGPAQGIVLIRGDWLWDNGTLWFRLEVGSTGTATTADSVALIPPVMGASDLQSFAAAVDAQLLKINGSSTMTGPLIYSNAIASGPPSATGGVRSPGTRLDLWNGTGAAWDHAIGIDASTTWISAGNAANFIRLAFAQNYRYTFDQNNLTLPTNPTGNMHAATKQYVDARVAKTGDTMTGALTMSGTWINMAGNSANIFLTMANNNNGQGTPVLQFRRLDNGRMAEFRAQQIGYNNNAEAQARLETMNGGWGWLNAWRTNVNSPPQVYFDGNISAGSVTNRCLATDKTNIQDPYIGEYNDPWDKLHVRKFKMKEGFDWDRTRWGFIAEELPEDVVAYAAPGSSDPSKMIKKREGLDIAQLLALTVAKVKELEARLEALQANVVSHQ